MKDIKITCEKAISINEFLAKKHLKEASKDIIDTILKEFEYNPFNTRMGGGKAIVFKFWVKSSDDMWVRTSNRNVADSAENIKEFLSSFYKDNEYLYFSFTSYLILNSKDTSHYQKYKEYEDLIKPFNLLIDKDEQGKGDIEIYIHIKNFEEDLSKLYLILLKLKTYNIIK